MFIRADAVFAIATDKFLASIIDHNCPHMQDTLRHILFISGEALLFNLAICFFFFFFFFCNARLYC